VIAISPFFVRAYLGYPLFGNCLPGVCDADKIPLIFNTVVSFFLNFTVFSWYCYMLTTTYFTYDERLNLITRLKALLDFESAEAEKVPFLKFETAENIIVWAKLRSFVLAFKSVEIRKIETILACLVIIILTVAAFIIYQRVHPFQSLVNEGVLFILSGLTGLFVGIYLIYPTIYTALLINGIQDDMASWFSDEKWRLAERMDLARNPAKRVEIRKCYWMCVSLHEHMEEIDSTFTIMGIKVTKGFFASILTAVGASLISWISTILNV